MPNGLFSIERFIDDLARFSETSDGVTRFPLTEQAKHARQYIADTMEQIGLTVFTDGVGNIHGQLAGSDLSNHKPLVLGSHFDSVRHAGKYDGVAGIACALAAVDMLLSQGLSPSFPIEILALEGEEGCEFKSPLIGSKALIGQLSLGELKQVMNSKGQSYYQQCEASALNPASLPQPYYRSDSIAGFIELHIEQAATLDRESIPVGIVTAISALQRIRIEFHGQANHAGATPMNQRSDALVTAAEFIHQVPTMLAEYGSPAATITCGHIECTPNRANVIPGFAALEIDIRDTSQPYIERLSNGVKHTVEQLGESPGLTTVFSILGTGDAVTMDESLRQQLTQSCQRLGIPHMDIHSGAGHDAGVFAQITPTAMVFVPSVDGYSHNPKEHTPLQFLEQGTSVLLDFLHHY